MGKYTFKPYSSKFKELYLKEKSKLKKILPTNTKIEHVGSTAVPGLGGKGIIDISILSPKKNLKRYMQSLEKEGFEYKPHPGDDKRKFMQKIIKYKEKERRVHIHLCLTKEFWNSFIAFRDYLRENNVARDEYAKIKREGAKCAKGDGKKYSEYKMDFLKKLAKEAIKKTK
ncbi:MAG: GrpB family protein [Candidatus Pacearchaeota archaeon]|nr:GrpB family protein [Candidatus Pacearchaeota archaeon]